MAPSNDRHRDDVPNHRDASAAAISASALLELFDRVEGSDREKYRDFALHQLKSLASPDYAAPLGTNGHFLLLRCRALGQ